MAYKFILPMNEGQGMVLYDKSGIGNHGLNYGDWAYTRYGKAVYLPSDSNFVTVTHNPTLNITSEVTLEGLLKIGEESPGGEFPADPAGWSWKRAISISPATPVDNYQIKVVLITSNFNYTHANADGSDLRFYTTDDVKLPYWIEQWDPTGTSIIWVKVTSSNTDTIYMYYGNPSASSESNGDAVFEFFDDFEAAGETTDYFASNGICKPTYGSIAPQGTHYNNKTFIVWQGTNLDPYAIEYDHTTGEWSDPVRVGDNPLSSDCHGAPAILRDTDGYLHVFYGCHASAIQHAKSNNPDDISAWTDKGGINPDGTYPQPVLVSSDIYLFYRSTVTAGEWNREAYRKSTDNGETWNSEQVIIDFGTGYTIYHGRVEVEGTSKIHISWNLFDYSDYQRKNVYHAYLNLTDLHMYAMDGTDLGTTIDKTEADNHCLVYDSGTNGAAFAKVHLDSDGVPYIIFVTDDNGYQFKFTKWNGSSWDTPITITSTDNLYNSFDFIVHSSSNIELYLANGGSAGRGGDIEKWLWNGSTWTKDSTVLSESTFGKPLNNPNIVQNYNSNLKVVFSEYKEDYSTPLKVFAFGESGFVQGEVGGLDTSKWTKDWTFGDGGSISISNSIITISVPNDSSGKGIKSNSNWAKPFIWRARAKFGSSGASFVGTYTIGNTNPASAAEQPGAIVGSSAHDIISNDADGTNYDRDTLITGGADGTTWYIAEVLINDGGYNDFYLDGVLKDNDHAYAYTDNRMLRIAKYKSSEVDVDWILIRKYASSEPSTTVGTEEEAGGGGPPVNLGALELKKGSAYGIGINGSQASAMINNNVITGDISPQVWNHVIMTYDGSSQKLYVNGQLRNSQSLSGAINTNTNSFEISTSGGPAYCAFARLNDNAFNESEVKARFAEVRDYTRMLYNCYGCDDGLVLYLPMHEGQGSVAGDQSGKGNDGVIYNANWTNVDGAYRLYFNGSNAYVDCGDDASLDLSDAITIIAWVKPYTVTKGVQRIIWHGVNSFDYELQMGYSNLNGGIRNTLGESYSITAAVMTANEWQHIAFTYDSSASEMFLYRNSIQVDSGTGVGKIRSSGLLRIGEYYPGFSDQFFNGIIDEVRIYNRALSEREISYHYQNQLPNHQ